MLDKPTFTSTVPALSLTTCTRSSVKPTYVVKSTRLSRFSSSILALVDRTTPSVAFWLNGFCRVVAPSGKLDRRGGEVGTFVCAGARIENESSSLTDVVAGTRHLSTMTRSRGPLARGLQDTRL